MSQTQQQKQQVFREKLQVEGADGFADGPRPWEQWDESGNQSDGRIWEGSARRIYPKQPVKRGFGDRLLSGLAMVALASLLVGITGVYFSTTSTPEQASSAIQPAPIIAGRQPATRESAPADTATSLASLETLSPPAAGTLVTPEQDKIVLEPALQPAPVISTDHVDRVAVETVITETAVTTTVYTQQPSQDEPELVATIATTPPPFTPASTENEAPAVTATQQTAQAEQAEKPATESVEIAQADVAVTEPETIEQSQTTAAVIDAQTTAAVPVPASDEQADAREPAVAEPAETPGDKPAVVETPAAVALNTTDAGVETAPDIAREIETATQTPVLPDAKTGKWVINLSSYTRKSTAERMLAVFKQKGIDAEVFTATVNDKPMHRIRIAGFQSSRSAKAEIPAIEQTLDLEGAWVSRR
jgi:hypothetical protein